MGISLNKSRNKHNWNMINKYKKEIIQKITIYKQFNKLKI